MIIHWEIVDEFEKKYHTENNDDLDKKFQIYEALFLEACELQPFSENEKMSGIEKDIQLVKMLHSV